MESEAQNDFDREIETLKSMFGELVSTAVIVAVLESCNGDVNLAAEGIMNMVCDGPDSTETENNAIALSYPVNELQSCQVMPSDNNAICLVDSAANVEQEPICPPPKSPLKTSGNEVNNDCGIQNPNLTSIVNPSPVSYAAAFRSTGAVPKIRDNTNNDNNVNKLRHSNNTSWNDQLKRILTYHNQGSRVMIIMRGVPGSGKSTLAQQIVEMTVGGSYQNYDTHIFCSDDYFLVRGRYQYDRNYLQEAHQNNQRSVYNATNHGLSPVIVDNTNVKIWEMEPYVRDAVRNGYYIEIVEPNTPWIRNATQLSRKNKHNVPKDKIRRMLDDYDRDVTATILMRTFRLRYPINKTPPIKRNSPPLPEVPITTISCNDDSGLPHSNVKQPEAKQSSQDIVDAHTSKAQTLTLDMNVNNMNSVDSEMFVIPKDTEMKRSEEYITNNDTDVLESEESKRLEVIIEAQKKLEEIENLEKEWENGESWVTETTHAEINNTSNVPKPPRNIQNVDEDTNIMDEIYNTSNVPKPPRNVQNVDEDTNIMDEMNMNTSNVQNVDEDTKIMEPSTFCDDWSKISLFMPPWQNNDASSLANQNAIHALETETKSTCMEIGDANNVIGLFKVVNCTPRDINEGNDYEIKKERIPDQRTLDKSTSTHEGALPAAHKCKNEEQHFIAFRKMFKHVPRPILRDVFDKCLGDVNWAVNIVLDGMSENEISTLSSEELSDTEEVTNEPCDCLAAYNIIPDKTSSSQEATPPIGVSQSSSVNSSPMHALQKKHKRERKISENEKTLELKRQIENNVMISDNHYSQHYLNLRRSRKDNDLKPSSTNSTNSEENLAATSNVGNLNESSEYPLLTNERIPQDSVINEQLNEQAVACSPMEPGPPSDCDSSSPIPEPESVSINLGTDFVKKLDELFGRQGIIYPENVKPIVSVPMSLLREINALWAESITFQMDSASKQTKEMIQEDEEFARELISKERELAREGKESQVPDFKEIMDMDLALSIYEKDVAEWRNNEPQDIAAKMSRNKLYGLFPEVHEDLLDEMLMAHDNNFQATVESLLISTGQGHILEQTNGVNKFIMEMEMQKKEILLEEERRRSLSEEEWPYLSRADSVVTMDEVTHYREEAQRYLDARNINRSKALYHANRNQFSVAAFYNDIAAFNVRRFEQANSRAAVSLIQYHATNRNDNDLIDLHYMRVAEAKEILDLFIDNQIQRLRDYKRATGKEPEAINLYFVTGRGMHSQGLPKIKPAVEKRLTDRELVPTECNPGLISTKISMHTKMTHEINRNR